MYQAREHETVNMILRNPTLWSEDMMTETLQRFKKSDSYAEHDISRLDVQELIKNYLLTLSDVMKREESVRKERKDENTFPDVNPLFVSGI